MELLIEAQNRIKALNGHNPFPLNGAKKFGYKIGIETAEQIIESIISRELRAMEQEMMEAEGASLGVIKELNSYPAKIEVK